MGDGRMVNVYRDVADDLYAGRITARAAMREVEAYYQHSQHPVATHEPML